MDLDTKASTSGTSLKKCSLPWIHMVATQSQANIHINEAPKGTNTFFREVPTVTACAPCLL